MQVPGKCLQLHSVTVHRQVLMEYECILQECKLKLFVWSF